MACELCHFYNYKYDEVINLDFETFDVLYNSMEQIKARNTLTNLTVQDWSHMKKENRNKMHRKIHDVAYPQHRKKVAITTEKLKGIGMITPQMVKNG